MESTYLTPFPAQKASVAALFRVPEAWRGHNTHSHTLYRIYFIFSLTPEHTVSTEDH